MRAVFAAVLAGSVLGSVSGGSPTNPPPQAASLVLTAERVQRPPQAAPAPPRGKEQILGPQTFGTNLVVTPSRPAPGVYKTEPYTCIVVVPGAHPDQKMSRDPGRGEPRMPVIDPGLRFVPWGQTAKTMTNAPVPAPKKSG